MVHAAGRRLRRPRGMPTVSSAWASAHRTPS